MTYTETGTWTNEQPDGSIVYGVCAKLYEDDGTYLGCRSRQWRLHENPPTLQEVEAARRRAVEYVEARVEEMRRRSDARAGRRDKQAERRRASEEELTRLPTT